MAKKISGYVKLQVPAGAANPSPPIGPALGQRGLNIMEFCKAFNAKTAQMEKGTPIPVIITAYQDRSFTFEMKQPPVSYWLKKAAKIDKDSQTAGKSGNAISTLQGAIQRFPDEPSIKIELASAYERQKKFAEAENLFRSLISTDPKNAEALNSLGYMLAERGQKLDESVGFVQRALTLDPGNPAFLDSLGWALFKQGKFDVAEQPLREASEKLPAVSVIQDHYGDLLAQRGDYQAAIDAWQRALDGDGDSITRADVESKIKSARQKNSKKK